MVAILGANSVSGVYEVSNSLRFNDDDSPNLQRTFSSGNQTDWTWSAWVKRGNISNNNQVIFGRQNVADGSNIGKILFTSSDELKLNNKVGASTGFEAVTFAKFRDPSAWYHIWISFDGNQSTHNDRASLYVNGVQFSWNSSSSLSAGNGHINLNLPHAVGFRAGDGGEQYDGYIAEMHFIDGNNSLNHTDFGEFDNNGVWIPKQYTGSYGTNGFYLEFKQTGTSQNSSGMGADTSSNDNHFAVTNLASTDITTDTCTNNFATANPLTARYNASNIKEASLILDAGGDMVVNSTQGFSSGKWYCELKSTITAGHGNRKWVGIISGDSDYTNPRRASSSYTYEGVGADLRNGQAFRGGVDGDATDISSFANNDICGLAYDADNGLLYFYKNGTIENSGNAINASNALDTSLIYNFHFNQDGGGTNNGELYLNFGNPPTGFTISSGNTDANGYGNFEYAPPSGYYALCTKNLAEFG